MSCAIQVWCVSQTVDRPRTSSASSKVERFVFDRFQRAQATRDAWDWRRALWGLLYYRARRVGGTKSGLADPGTTAFNRGLPSKLAES